MPPKDPYKVPKEMQAKDDDINGLTDEVCMQHLNAEYAELVRRATAALARKRPSPLARGWTKTWACAVVYAVGQVNFLFDKTQTPTCEAMSWPPHLASRKVLPTARPKWFVLL